LRSDALRCVSSPVLPPFAGPVYIGSGWGHTALWLTLRKRSQGLFSQEWERGWIGTMRELFERGF
jgi:hypothetical protein